MNSIGELLKDNKYREKLEDKRWKEFSRSIKERRGGGCQSCHRTDLGLQIHHIFYETGRDPWDYGDEDVVVLCGPCHKELHEQLKKFRKFVFGKMTPRVLQILNGALSVAFDSYDPLVFAHALAEFVSTPTMVDRYAKAWGTNGQGVVVGWDDDPIGRCTRCNRATWMRNDIGKTCGLTQPDGSRCEGRFAYWPFSESQPGDDPMKPYD